MLHCIKSFGEIEKYSNDGFFIVKAMQNLAYCSIESMNGGVPFAKTVLFVINDFINNTVFAKGTPPFMLSILQ